MPKAFCSRGNAQNGEKIFRASCAGCHRVNGAGGRLGPDLSRIGVARARDAIVFQIRRGREELRPGFEPVTLTPQTGEPIRGVKKNEDLFSVQIMDTTERIQGYEKDKMKAVENGTRSAMPVAASPAPRNKTRWSASFPPFTRNAENRPASATAAVP